MIRGGISVMSKETAEGLNWDEILENFYSYKGTIVTFCNENNISHHQLYYRRKKANKENNKVFHAITINEEVKPHAPHIYPKDNKEIKIQIGTAIVYIPYFHEELLLKIVKELSS